MWPNRFLSWSRKEPKDAPNKTLLQSLEEGRAGGNQRPRRFWVSSGRTYQDRSSPRPRNPWLPNHPDPGPQVPRRRTHGTSGEGLHPPPLVHHSDHDEFPLSNLLRVPSGREEEDPGVRTVNFCLRTCPSQNPSEDEKKVGGGRRRHSP